MSVRGRSHGFNQGLGLGILQHEPAGAGIQGIVIEAVDEASPAAQAGLRPYDPRSGELGDVITAVNGRALPSVQALVAELDRAGLGTEVELTVVRNVYPDRREERRLRLRVVDLQK